MSNILQIFDETGESNSDIYLNRFLVVRNVLDSNSKFIGIGRHDSFIYDLVRSEVVFRGKVDNIRCIWDDKLKSPLFSLSKQHPDGALSVIMDGSGSILHQDDAAQDYWRKYSEEAGKVLCKDRQPNPQDLVLKYTLSSSTCWRGKGIMAEKPNSFSNVKVSLPLFLNSRAEVADRLVNSVGVLDELRELIKKKPEAIPFLPASHFTDIKSAQILVDRLKGLPQEASSSKEAEAKNKTYDEIWQLIKDRKSDLEKVGSETAVNLNGFNKWAEERANERQTIARDIAARHLEKRGHSVDDLMPTKK